MARKQSKQRRILSTRYQVRVVRNGKRIRLPFGASSAKREAIRLAHAAMRKAGAGAHGEVTTKEGALIYQAKFKLVAGRPRFVVEEL